MEIDQETNQLITSLCNSDSEPEKKIGQIMDLLVSDVDPEDILILTGIDPCDFCDEFEDCDPRFCFGTIQVTGETKEIEMA